MSKIHANELRIGNLIGCDGNILVVEKIDVQNNIGYGLFEKSKGQHVNSGNKYFIEFTENWVKRAVNLDIFHFEIYGDDTCGFHIDLDGAWLFIKYLHDFQNLFFALTRQELELKLQPE